jgi:hypothetical protein
MAAIRETFEESGILLAKNKSTGELLQLDETEREKGRKAIHAGTISFPVWLAEKGGIADIGTQNFPLQYSKSLRICSTPRNHMIIKS